MQTIGSNRVTDDATRANILGLMAKRTGTLEGKAHAVVQAGNAVGQLNPGRDATEQTNPAPAPSRPARWAEQRRETPKSRSSTHTHMALGPARGALLVGQWHALEKRLAQTTDPLLRKQLKQEQAKLGGLKAYQAVSVKGADKLKGGESSKWLVKQWEEIHGRGDIRLLDVGAIAGTAYAKWRWIHTTSIDLNPQAPAVLKADFFDLPVPASAEELYDVVALSLVLNFVGDLNRRSAMLRRAHEFLKPSGYLYVVLPLACVSNSRYLDHDRLRGILKTLGWAEVRQHDSAKLTYWLLQRRPPEGQKADRTKWGKVEVRPGANRNNFCIRV